VGQVVNHCCPNQRDYQNSDNGLNGDSGSDLLREEAGW
jgi:hypothetical protein